MINYLMIKKLWIGLLDQGKKNCSVIIFLAHSYFKMSKTLRLNVNYIILFKISKNHHIISNIH